MSHEGIGVTLGQRDVQRWQTAHSCMSPLDIPPDKHTMFIILWNWFNPETIVKASELDLHTICIHDLHSETQDNFNIPKVFWAWPCCLSAAVTLQLCAWPLSCAASRDSPACCVKTQERVPRMHSHYVVNELLSVCGRGLQLCVGGRFSRKIFHYAEEILWWAAAAIPLALVKQ